MSTVTTTAEPLIRNYRRGNLSCRRKTKLLLKPNGLNVRLKPFSYNGGSLFCKFKCHKIKASSSMETAVVETSESSEVLFKETFPLKRTQKVEGKLFARLDQAKDEKNWQLSVGCGLPGKWILHWGVSYIDDIGSEWDQPPNNMRPPGSIPIKDYAIETPLKKSSEGDKFHQVKIDIDSKR